MSAAKKCDICGKLYEVYNYMNNPDKPNGMRFTNEDIEFNDTYDHPIIDCCPECMAYIKSFIERLKNEPRPS